jgi:hypothetical protein
LVGTDDFFDVLFVQDVLVLAFLEVLGGVDEEGIVGLFALVCRWCSCRESNPDLRFRKPPFYPLNYRSMAFVGNKLSGQRGLKCQKPTTSARGNFPETFEGIRFSDGSN